MQFLLLAIYLFSLADFTHSAILKTSMSNNYPQVAVLGCENNKANLYYDVQRRVWVEHLVSSCVNDEESTLKFCQQAYPSLQIRNIIRLDTVLSFANWCELIPAKGDDIPRCKPSKLTEESVQSFRCLHDNSQQEDSAVPTIDCTMHTINRPGECLRTEKWQELATLDCSNRTMMLNSSIIPLESCGLSAFRRIKFFCCIINDIDDNQLEEDDSVQEFVIVPKPTTVETHRKIIAMSLGSREPKWMDDYRRWNSDAGYFADDEDTSDDQEEIKLSSPAKSHLTINEHERFSKDKEEFKRKYKQQVDELKSRWQTRQNEIQLLANEDPNTAQQSYEKSEVEFRQDYDFIKQTAARERTRINELHENNLDSALDIAKTETEQKLTAAWNESPIKTEKLKEALFNYLHVLLRDRIHLVNRYERLRVVDPEQAKRKRIVIHERLRSIAYQINDALNKLRRYSKFQLKIQPYLDTLLAEYDEVNQAAEKLVIDYLASTSTTFKPRLAPLGRDEKKIYPFSASTTPKIDEDSNNNEYDYDKNDDDDDDDDYEDDDDDDDESTTSVTTTEFSNSNNDQFVVGESDWDVQVDTDETFNRKFDSDNDNIRPLMPINRRRWTRSFFTSYLPYILGCLIILCLIFGLVIVRIILQQRRKSQYGHQYEKNYVFTEVDCASPEEKALHALQMSGYENPTYKYFESQTAKC